MPDQRWFVHPVFKGEAQWLSQQISLSPLLAQVLINRGIEAPEAAAEFINPESLLLPSPLDEFPDLEQSIEILLQAIELQEKIAICGDYDADGMTSTALLIRALRLLGADVDYAIPSRMQEGYGINNRIVEEFYTDGFSVILTVDNGIAAVDPIAYARELGMTVIVTDHHDVPPQIPPAHAILNPKLITEESPYRGVAGVGVAYILAVCLAQAMGRIQDLTAPLLELFTLGTIADLAPLTGVNRRWVRRGLGLLPKSRLIGVQALIQVAGLGDENETLKPEDIGFRLGPRINAIGRIGDPQVVIEMLTTEDVDVALQRALECEQANQKRREMCDRIEAEAIAWIEAQIEEGAIDWVRDRVLLVLQPDWHHGVIGIVASRLVERYGVPVFICTYEDADRKEVRGSARGIPEFDVFEALQSCHDLMAKFGGHQAAGGFSFPTKYLRQVKSRLVNFANRTLEVGHLKPLVTVDVRTSLRQLTRELYEQIDALHPCGIGNPAPIFWTPNVRVVEQRAIGKTKAHLKLKVAEDEGDAVEAIAWRWGRYCPLPGRLDIAYKLKLNEWQGNTSIQLELVGVRPPTSSSLPPSVTKSAKPARSSAAPTLTLPLPDSATTVAEPRSPQPSPTISDGVSRSPSQHPSPPASFTPVPSTQVPPISAPSAQVPSNQVAFSPSQEPDAITIDQPETVTSVDQANFFYGHRRYLVRTFKKGTSRELQIHNPEKQIFVVLLPEKQGYLCIPGEAPRPVDIGEAHYFNLIRAGLDALEIRQKTHLLLEKDELLAEKDEHIQTLTQQVEFLKAKVGAFSSTQKQEFKTLQAEVKAQESAIQNQEAHIATLQQQMGRPAPKLDPKEIKRTVRLAVGDKIWYFLQPESQKDLYAAHKHVALNATDNADLQSADYTKAGLRLGSVVKREVIQPWFEDLAAFLADNGSFKLGDVLFGPGQNYTASMAAPLLADQWTSVRSQSLAQKIYPGDDHVYFIATAKQPLSQRDRALLSDFLQQWEHPMSGWLQSKPQEVATYLDQFGQLYTHAARKTLPLYLWAFDVMQHLVIGNGQQRGMFQHIYGTE
ncbi:single-stranded-DNA-specific exonuclease RecJ [Oscillatoria sp. CS-180]|nr:single-stranded-DNA-specific exonuclease RecJ [Oscillatoria sp. CS-180]MDB9528044.1 single-stranded-DNA-specific exonuclease RecJ [Oscillatoria sp. CS-180]